MAGATRSYQKGKTVELFSFILVILLKRKIGPRYLNGLKNVQRLSMESFLSGLSG